MSNPAYGGGTAFDWVSAPAPFPPLCTPEARRLMEENTIKEFLAEEQEMLRRASDALMGIPSTHQKPTWPRF